MKKFILASAFALMATPALFAQSSNTYSMQIELKDGTKITLGPNDLKNITFVDGVIKIEGNTIEELRSSIAKAEANTKNMVEEQRYNVENLNKKASDLQAMIDYLSVKVAQLEKAEGGSGNAEDITALQAAIATLQSELAKLQSSEMATKTDVVATNNKITNVLVMVTETEAAIMDLQKAVKDLQSSGSGSVSNEERIKLLEETVAKLQVSLDNMPDDMRMIFAKDTQKLQAQIDDLLATIDALAFNSSGNKAMIKELESELAEVKRTMSDLKVSAMGSQEKIDQLKMETSDNLATTKAELQERIMSIRNELLEVLAKTNSEIERSTGLVREDTKAKLEELKGYLLNAIAEKDLEGQQRDEDLHNETRKWVQEVDDKVSYVWDTLIKQEIMERLLNIEERLDQIQQR